MPSPREYREHLYRLRTHPEGEDGQFNVDRRDSFTRVYLSAVPFFALEWLIDRNFPTLPQGLVMPVGFLLFWAFYYTYYKPGFLEERLSSPTNWRLSGVLTVLLGVILWFVKVTVVELSQVLLLRWLLGEKRRWSNTAEKPSAAPPRPDFQRVPDRSELTNGGGSYREFTGSAYSPPPMPPRATATPPPLMPPDVRHALHVLGLPAARVEWELIHRKYRELAKKYHPDLNQDGTDIGRRFMAVDAAYRRLAPMRGKYFPDSQRMKA